MGLEPENYRLSCQYVYHLATLPMHVVDTQTGVFKSMYFESDVFFNNALISLFDTAPRRRVYSCVTYLATYCVATRLASDEYNSDGHL